MSNAVESSERESDVVTSRGKERQCESKKELRLRQLRLGHAAPSMPYNRTFKQAYSLMQSALRLIANILQAKNLRSFSGLLTKPTKVDQLNVDTRGKVDVVSANGHR